MSKIIAVHGATGTQGGSVVKALLNSDWKVIAITRSAVSDAAKALTAAGAEVMTANFEDEASLVTAYEGVDAIFLVTNFWGHLLAGKSASQSGEAEFKEAMAVVKLADKLPSLKHLIWSTVPGNAEGQRKRTAVPHFDYKAQVDATIRNEYPSLAAKTTFLYIGYYANNLADSPMVKPFTTPASFGSYVWLMPVPRTVMLPMAGDTAVNVGVFTKAILMQPEKTKGKYVGCIVETMTQEKLLQCWSAATGKNVAYLQVDAGDWIKAFGPPGEETYLNLKAFEENESWYMDNNPLLAKDLGIESEIVDTQAFLEMSGERLL
ncbi:NAD(P)-binding domain protein [Akanthomyces lecanii RCEF 1005]|uniref:NAD(P)-binding domain protein n=1 Tax=Akanthomyces lecanii RCEF 1005 TaxID=1081108 RepID=A0A167WS75_CORDF|nr:NAD(P)-binding domain protein [Akanthomyces lecanii RCEF 1005]